MIRETIPYGDYPVSKAVLPAELHSSWACCCDLDVAGWQYDTQSAFVNIN